MAENRNGKKRSRENVESATHPPSKKRRIQSKQSKKSRNKDMNKWTIGELKKYLNKHAITFQMNKDKTYYYRLASMHKTVQENKAKEKREKQRQNSQIVNGVPHSSQTNPPQSPINKKNENESPSEPVRAPTPPLPSSLSRRPFTSDTFSDENNNSQKQQDIQPSPLLSQRAFKNKPQTIIDSPSPSPVSTPTDSDKVSQIITPHSLKSRSNIQTATPSNPSSRTVNQQTLITPPRDLRNALNVSQRPRTPYTGYPSPNNTQETLATGRRLGPFQDIPAMFSFDGYSMPRIPKVNVPSFEIPGFSKKYTKYMYSDNKYLVLLCAAVLMILMAMCIPYIISLFVQTPYCDNNSDAIIGSYAVFNDIVPLESIMKCQSCPYNAQCSNGTAECALNYELDEYHTMCLDNNDKDAVFASHIANKAYYILGRKLGDWECNGRNDSFMYELDETSLKAEIKTHFADKDGSATVEFLSENAAETETDGSEPVKAVEADNITNQSQFDDEWQYATTKIMPFAYQNRFIVHEDGVYKSLRPIPSSIYCKAVYLKREYVEEIGMNFSVVWAFTMIGMAVLLVLIGFRSKATKVDETAVVAANFVLQKLSQQRELHFSITQFKHFTMQRKGISAKTWATALKYINESGFVATIPEDIDGEVRMCWVWKAPVPFVALVN